MDLVKYDTLRSARLNETSITCSVICRRHENLLPSFFVELTGRRYFDLFGKVGPLCTVFETAERFHPRGQQLCKIERFLHKKKVQLPQE